MDKTLSSRQRGVLKRLAKTNGQPASYLSGSQSGNVLENLLQHDLISIHCAPKATLVFITPKGRTALTFNSYVVER